NYLAVARTDGSEWHLIFSSERTIIHPQFHPANDTLIEYAQDPAPRMWLIRRDGSENTCLYFHTNDEFVVHETWLGTAGDLVFTHWPYALKRLDGATGQLVNRSIDCQFTNSPISQLMPQTVAEFNAWHIAPNRAG